MEPVLRFHDLASHKLKDLLGSYGMILIETKSDQAIPGSFWGDDEAGLVGNKLYARPETPVHSILHEACHYICMPPCRRANLHTNAGGDYDEENAVCYLQIILADQLPEMGHKRMFADMDSWGYTFRLGSAKNWYEHDAQDAVKQLKTWNIINESGTITGKPREQ